jgi:CDP-4-dehydro-6-deoxyglucose reductase
VLETLHYVAVLSRADTAWTGMRGHVQDAFLAHKPLLANVAVYACGSDAMIHASRASLTAAGLPPQRFYSDAFVSSN